MNLRVERSALLPARVMHHRFTPRRNHFSYGVFYLLQDVDEPKPARGAARLWLLSQDHGFRDGRSLRSWADAMLERMGLAGQVHQVLLLAMPRCMGYVFNPISFWLCVDEDSGLLAILCEVSNTFGETHSYLCCKTDRSAIVSGDRIEAEKVFHVSPFIDRSGSYRFDFDLRKDRLAIHINYQDADGKLLLRTSLSGNLLPHTRANERKLQWRYPLVTIRTITLIHLQALRLFCKRIRYRPKPAQLKPEISLAQSTTVPRAKQ